MSSKSSPVLFAVVNGDGELLRAALRRSLASRSGCSASSSELSDALYEAVHRKRTDCVRLLLDAGADPDVASSRADRLAIFRAAQDENWPLVEMLALPPERQSLTVRDVSPSATAAGTVRNGTAGTRATENGSTVLHWACRRGAPKSTLQCLISAGCDVNARSKDGGLTPLMLAVQHRSYAAVDVLVAAGCKLDVRNGQGQTALLIASGSGFCVSPLLDAGADASLADDAGNTALIAAASEGLCTVVARLCAVLRERHGDSSAAAAVDVRNAAGLAALHIAATKGHTECVEAIVDAGGDPALADGDGGTALYHAVAASGCRGANTIECLARLTPRFDWLLASGAASSRCPVRRAAEGGHSAALVALLLVSGDTIAIAAAALLWWHRRRQQQTPPAAGVEERLEQLLVQCAEWSERRAPRDLKALCRESVRGCLGRAVLPRTARRLPLPPALQDYVAMLRTDNW